MCPRAPEPAPDEHSEPSQSPSAISFVPGSGMLANAHQEVILSEVLVPGWVQDAVGSSEDPPVTDKAGPTQQLLGTLPKKHHLPNRKQSALEAGAQALAALEMGKELR